MKVDFVIIGAMKSGTTSLAYQLAQHPRICFSQPKETHFFSTTYNWEDELDRYHAFFNPLSDQLCGEASPTYTCLPEYPGTAQRLYAYNPNMKLIYIVRQPIQRIMSHYAHRVIRDNVEFSPEVAIFTDPTYINRTRYAVQLQPYFELFPPQNIFLLVFEEYISSLQKTLYQVAEFLGICPEGFKEVDLSVKNRSVVKSRPRVFTRVLKPFARLLSIKLPDAFSEIFYRRRSVPKPTLSSEVEELIWRFLEYDVRKLENMLGKSGALDIWREKKSELDVLEMVAED